MARPQESRPRRMTTVVVDTDVVSFVFKNHPIGSQYDADLADSDADCILHDFGRIGPVDNPVEVERGSAKLVASVPGIVRLYAVCPRPLHEVGRGDRLRAGERISDRMRGRLDRGHSPSLRFTPCYPQSWRLSRRAGPRADLA